MLKNEEEGIQNYITIVTPEGDKVQVRVEEVIKLLSIIGNAHDMIHSKYFSLRIGENECRKIEEDIWYLIANYYIGIELPPIIPRVRAEFKDNIQNIELEFGVTPDKKGKVTSSILNYLYDSIGSIKERHDITFEYLISRLVDPDARLEYSINLGQMIVKSNIKDFNKLKWVEYCKLNLKMKSENRFKIPREILKYQEKKEYINMMKEDFKKIDNKDKQFKKFNKEEFEKIKEDSIGDVKNHINDKKIDKQLSLF